MSCENEHYHGHGHNHNHDGHDHDHVAPIPTLSSQSLNSKVDLDKVSALNMANPKSDLARIFKSAETKYEVKPVIRSDCDEQLIIIIPFLNGSVKLYSLILRTNGEEYCPKVIKLFKNDTSIDFDNLEGKKPTQTINHPQIGLATDIDDEDGQQTVVESEDTFVEHYLSRPKFTGVEQLTLVVESIHDESEDQSRIHSIELRGEFTELNRDPVVTLYEQAANPADHKTTETRLENQNQFQFGS
ncbi:hypothetical protein PVL30_001286 [Lodderomyces elongisporus]|uniref:uncharacterized protein n=1 Tax=Lodderomyces elongisporus TaxID=36914 RepID=UPI002920B1F1|nr:uncharacterized protein PVL30_001286 [Lodderomyces elongisporus]WLF77568.1 hypothetical protein PVL30_001286 [Lodderomyces elongisporus]